MLKTLRNGKTWISLRALASVLVLVSSAAASAEIAVIVNTANQSDVSPKLIEDIYLGKRSKFPDGQAAKPVDQTPSRPIYQTFHAKLSGMNAADLNTHWSTLIFTGVAVPPKKLASDEEVLNHVRTVPGGIGYIDAKAADSSVKVVHRLP